MSYSTQCSEYWLPGYGLSRHIVFGQLQYFLGPSATVRAYAYQVKYLSYEMGARLTPLQGPRRLSHQRHEVDKTTNYRPPNNEPRVREASNNADGIEGAQQ